MKNVKSMENLEKLERLFERFPANNWQFYADKLRWSKGKFYDYANSLVLQGKAENKNGLWYPKKAEVKRNIDLTQAKLGFLGLELAVKNSPTLKDSQEVKEFLEKLKQLVE
ncbi:MAG: hypothetical protein QXL57_08485 [Candidatus Bathyarchaeia archaeon]